MKNIYLSEFYDVYCFGDIMNENLAPLVKSVIAVGPPAIIVVFNPYLFYTALVIFMLTCFLVCIHIILNCARRDKRIDAVTSRAVRRAHAKSSTN
jgi:type IV secretory pathway TrbD component